MGKVLIEEQYLKDIANSIRKMTGKKDPITTDSMAREIESSEIVWDPEERWARPLDWPDYDSLNLFKNMIGKSIATSGGYLGDDGSITSTSGWYYTEYITVKPNTDYVASSISNGGSGTYYCLYDKNKTLTRSILIVANENQQFTTANNEVFVRFSVRDLNNEFATAQLEEGTTPTAYSPFFEGMYFTYDTSRANNYDEWAGFYCACSGGYKIERGQIVNGQFVVEATTNKNSGAEHREWLSPTITGYVVYRITPQVANSKITSIGIRNLPKAMTGSDLFVDLYYQPILERYGRLPNLTSFSYWGNVFCKSDTILDLRKLTTLGQTWYNSYAIENIDITGFDSIVSSCYCVCYNCKQLRYINNVDKFVTSSCTNIANMFCNCANLKYVDVSTWDTSNVTTLGSTFDTCSSLYKLDVSNWNTSKVTTMYATFAGCRKLKQLDVSNFDTSKVTDMYYMFGGCDRLEEIDVSNFNTSNVTRMSYMFYTMTCIKSIDCSSFDTSKVNNMSYMFSGCKNLEYLDVHTFDTSKVTTMQQMFYNCGGLKDLNLSNFDFSDCITFTNFLDTASTSLKDFHIDFSTSGVTVTGIGSMFSNLQNLCGTLDLSDMTISQTNPGSVFRYCYRLNEIKMPTSLNSIGTYCFDYCRCLTKLVLPSTTLVALANTNAFTNRNNCQLTIYVPDNLVSSYQTATNWKSLTYVTFAGLSTYTDD